MVALDAISNKTKTLGQVVSWTKTKIQDSKGLLGEPIQSVHACGEGAEVTEFYML